MSKTERELFGSDVARRFRVALVLVGLLVLTLGASSAAMNAGVCLSEMRLLKDMDYYRGAISVVITDPIDGITEHGKGYSTSKRAHSQKYATTEQFLADFPDCCRIFPPNFGDGGDNVDGFDQFVGYRTVLVSYVKRYLGGDGTQRTAPVTAQVAVSHCGVGRSFR
ncbi:hypothetical protein LRC39_15195 [Rhodopseudomonas sp. P1]|uniref:hypothetical protein n=1 Tax=Rhodopseudomonas sp. P1 TaxID=3434357 RepID=UPI0031FBAC60